MQLRPKRLERGDRIGIVSPAYWIEPEMLQRAVGVFEQCGYELVLGKTTGLKDNKFAGSAAERAADIMAMFADPSIDAIICVRGGYGGNRVLPLLDYDVIRANPKIFVGFSDITGFLSSISQRSGLVTFHGPMLTTYGENTVDYNLDTFHRVLSGEEGVKIESAPECTARILRPGNASGPLWGGNLSLVEERLGTAGQIDTNGAILLLEEVHETMHAFDRMMFHLKEAGSLEHVKGLVLGEILEMSDTEDPFGKDTDEIVLDVCGDLGIPIISNFPCGHGACQATLPVSHEIELHAEGESPFIMVPESPVV